MRSGTARLVLPQLSQAVAFLGGSPCLPPPPTHPSLSSTHHPHQVDGVYNASAALSGSIAAMQPPLEALGDAAGRLAPAVSRALGAQGAELAAALEALDGADLSQLTAASDALNSTVLPAIRDSIQPVGAPRALQQAAWRMGDACLLLKAWSTSEEGGHVASSSHGLLLLSQAFEDLYDWQPPTMSIQASLLRCLQRGRSLASCRRHSLPPRRSACLTACLALAPGLPFPPCRTPGAL